MDLVLTRIRYSYCTGRWLPWIDDGIKDLLASNNGNFRLINASANRERYGRSGTRSTDCGRNDGTQWLSGHCGADSARDCDFAAVLECKLKPDNEGRRRTSEPKSTGTCQRPRPVYPDDTGCYSAGSWLKTRRNVRDTNDQPTGARHVDLQQQRAKRSADQWPRLSGSVVSMAVDTHRALEN